ncbi:3-hydroxyisobutyrate dehydrogenase [Luteococcus sp. Sow4_B9]|uniref:3-hydroxyisobutyrate dehydrogenase n=1 Tax=Luteococcus sp. Sow4_B9 TaxID=3438792 RepID=UPI003F9B6EE0
MTQTTVAFIGLGNMGAHMAANCAKAGFTVRGFDPVSEARTRAEEYGIINCASAAEAASQAQVVVTSLPNGKILLGALTGEDGLLAAAPAGTLFIDTSTVGVADCLAAREAVMGAGHTLVESPMSGGTVGAEKGTLTFMVGADDEADLERARPVLEAMGAKIVHCGGAGAGQAVKLCNNMVLAINMIGISEAFVLAERLGVSHQAFFDVASTSTAQSWALNTNCPVPGPVPTSPANRNYEPGFMGALMAKDLGLALGAIDLSGTDAQLGRLAVEFYRQFSEGEGARKDFSGIINSIREQSTDQEA